MASRGARRLLVVLLAGYRINHILHTLLSFVSVGEWMIVWLLLALMGGEKRKTVNVDEWGRILSGERQFNLLTQIRGDRWQTVQLLSGQESRLE